ncbi:hypothetical protein OUZ56_029686 [Daphnia magna]|uniref:Retrotransposon gag domain-containing protein n=1 Tax=Daphnia magna TaxID=35525 RepID=A0ABR0B7J6_9CRUS|nr:hypothetical protein OUZ56_029686 [Daphnia magna]
MAAVTKLIRPSNFRGSPTEDARQWLESYETISTYNSWGDADQRNIFSMYLDDTARNEFLCAKLLNDWQDTAAHATAGGNPATSARPVSGVEPKELMSQPLDWSTQKCQKLHLLEHLFRGLQPTLFRKIYPLKPKTCEEFLIGVTQIHVRCTRMEGYNSGAAEISRAVAKPFCGLPRPASRFYEDDA